MKLYRQVKNTPKLPLSTSIPPISRRQPKHKQIKSQVTVKRWKHLVCLDDFINSTRLDPVIADQGTKRNVSKRIGIKPLITSMSRGQPVVNPLILGCCLTQQSLHPLEF